MQTVTAGPSISARDQVVALQRFGRRVRDAMARVWLRARESETVYFLRLLRISRAGDPQATYAATLAWLDRAWRGADLQPPTPLGDGRLDP